MKLIPLASLTSGCDAFDCHWSGIWKDFAATPTLASALFSFLSEWNKRLQFQNMELQNSQQTHCYPSKHVSQTPQSSVCCSVQPLAAGCCWLSPNAKRFCQRRQPFIVGETETGGGEEGYGKQSIEGKAARALALALSFALWLLRIYVHVSCRCCLGERKKKCVSCSVAPCPGFDLSLPWRIQANRPLPRC